MQCLRCGRAFEGKIALCPACFSQGRVNTLSHIRESENFEHSRQHAHESHWAPAGFWLRFFGYLFDQSLIALINLLLATIYTVALDEKINTLLKSQLANTSMSTAVISSLIIAALSFVILQLVMGLIYYAFFEGSRLQATPGKVLMGLQVATLNRERIYYVRAALRHLLKALWIVPLLIPFFVLISGSQKIGGYIIVPFSVAAVILCIWQYVMAGVTEQKQTLYDILSKSLVLKNNTVSFGRRAITAIFSISFAILVSVVTRDRDVTESKLRQVSTKLREANHNLGVGTVPFHTSLNPALPDPTPSPKEAYTSTASAFGSSRAFPYGLAVYDPARHVLELGLYSSALSATDFRVITSSGTFVGTGAQLPDLSVSIVFKPGAAGCNLQAVSSYVVTFFRKPGGFDFPGSLPSIEFARVASGLQIEGLSELVCGFSDEAPIRIQFEGDGSANRFNWNVGYRGNLAYRNGSRS